MFAGKVPCIPGLTETDRNCKRQANSNNEDSITNSIELKIFHRREKGKHIVSPTFGVDPNSGTLSLLPDSFLCNLQKIKHTSLRGEVIILIYNLLVQLNTKGIQRNYCS
jgi:hypothetical protein